MHFINDLTCVNPWQGLINSSMIFPLAIRLRLPSCLYCLVFSLALERIEYLKLYKSVSYISLELKKAFFFCTLSLVGAQCREIRELCWGLDSVIRSVLADCQMSLFPNIVLSICPQISPEPASSQI